MNSSTHLLPQYRDKSTNDASGDSHSSSSSSTGGGRRKNLSPFTRFLQYIKHNTTRRNLSYFMFFIIAMTGLYFLFGNVFLFQLQMTLNEEHQNMYLFVPNQHAKQTSQEERILLQDGDIMVMRHFINKESTISFLVPFTKISLSEYLGKGKKTSNQERQVESIKQSDRNGEDISKKKVRLEEDEAKKNWFENLLHELHGVAKGCGSSIIIEALFIPLNQEDLEYLNHRFENQKFPFRIDVLSPFQSNTNQDVDDHGQESDDEIPPSFEVSAFNQAAREATGQYIYLNTLYSYPTGLYEEVINSNQFHDEFYKKRESLMDGKNWLHVLIEMFRSKKDVRAIASKVIIEPKLRIKETKDEKKDDNALRFGFHFDDKTLHESQYQYQYIIKSAGMDAAFSSNSNPVLFNRLNGYSYLDSRSFEESNVIAAPATGLIIHRGLFNQIGGLDYINYPTQHIHKHLGSYIVQDLCMKIREIGYKIIYEPFSHHVISSEISHQILDSENQDRKKKENSKLSWFSSYSSDESLEDYMKKMEKEREEKKNQEKQRENISKQFHSRWGKYLRSIAYSKYELPNMRVAWDFGAGSCTGWFMEAVNFVVALEQQFPLRIITGRDDMCEGLPASVDQSLNRLLDNQFDNITVWIAHKPPDRYPKFPYKGVFNIPGHPKYVIGRSMYESTSIPESWVDRCNDKLIDEIWVPSKFLIDIFSNAGVTRDKLVYIPEPIDIHFYDPDITKPYPLEGKSKFNFLSVFKWEFRKGPDILFEAYFKEFTKNDDVTLFVSTYLFMDFNPRSKDRINDKILEIAKKLNIDAKNLPRYEILSSIMPTTDMPSLYKAVDCFVLPTRGEGFGLPLAEAMAMGLPTIGTSFSGPTDFMNKQNSYMLDVEAYETEDGEIFEDIDDPNVKGRNLYARPSVNHLRRLMRHVYQHPESARVKGNIAREFMSQEYSQEKLTSIVTKRLKEIDAIIQSRSQKNLNLERKNNILRRPDVSRDEKEKKRKLPDDPGIRKYSESSDKHLRRDKRRREKQEKPSTDFDIQNLRERFRNHQINQNRI